MDNKYMKYRRKDRSERLKNNNNNDDPIFLTQELSKLISSLHTTHGINVI